MLRICIKKKGQIANKEQESSILSLISSSKFFYTEQINLEELTPKKYNNPTFGLCYLLPLSEEYSSLKLLQIIKRNYYQY